MNDYIEILKREIDELTERVRALEKENIELEACISELEQTVKDDNKTVAFLTLTILTQLEKESH